jgi:AraC-like DNA-binding protein
MQALGCRGPSMNPLFEAVQSDISSSFRSRHFKCESFAQDHPWHYHPEYELTWIIASSGTRFVGDSIQGYAAGDLVLVGPDLPHCWQNDTVPGAQTPELTVVQFHPAGFGSSFLGLQEVKPLAALLDRASRGLAFDAATAARVGALLRDLVELQGLGRLARLLEILHTLSSAEGGIPLASADYRPCEDLDPSRRRKLELVRRYVDDNLGAEIRQAEIAARLWMSSPVFSRFFKVATGGTFISYVNRARVKEACRLLNCTEQSVTDVAMRCGYQNISNFNRQFRALKGMNPSEYRLCLRECADKKALWIASTEYADRKERFFQEDLRGSSAAAHSWAG